jgi:hypothetical protein
MQLEHPAPQQIPSYPPSFAPSNAPRQPRSFQPPASNTYGPPEPSERCLTPRSVAVPPFKLSRHAVRSDTRPPPSRTLFSYNLFIFSYSVAIAFVGIQGQSKRQIVYESGLADFHVLFFEKDREDGKKSAQAVMLGTEGSIRRALAVLERIIGEKWHTLFWWEKNRLRDRSWLRFDETNAEEQEGWTAKDHHSDDDWKSRLYTEGGSGGGGRSFDQFGGTGTGAAGGGTAPLTAETAARWRHEQYLFQEHLQPSFRRERDGRMPMGWSKEQWGRSRDDGERFKNDGTAGLDDGHRRAPFPNRMRRTPDEERRFDSPVSVGMEDEPMPPRVFQIEYAPFPSFFPILSPVLNLRLSYLPSASPSPAPALSTPPPFPSSSAKSRTTAPSPSSTIRTTLQG